MEELGMIISFKTSFKPSANGCSKPQNPTMFGPQRRCTEAINFRSAKVKYAIDISNEIKLNIVNNKFSKNTNQVTK